MHSSTRAVALLSLVVVFAGSPRTQAAEDQWFVASSSSDSAIGQDSSSAVDLLETLTIARTVMKELAAVDLPLPVRAFAVKNEASMRELVPQYWERRGVRPHGASYTGPHASFIVVRTDIPDSRQFPLLLHEYVHLLTTAHAPGAPAWLDEGLSEFWGALVVDSRNIVIGRPPAHHLRLLRTRPWLPLAQMQQHQRGKLVADPDQALMFYAQSWAMVHYLLLGGNQAAPLSFAPSVRQLSPQLDLAVRAYVEEGRYSEIASPSPQTKLTSPTPQPISEARALAERANMLVFGERPDAALPIVRKSLSLNSREPLALEAMGTDYFLRNQPDQAREWLSQALEADPASYRSALYLALLSASTSDREHYLQIAVRAKPDSVVAWERLWALYQDDGRAEQTRRWCGHVTKMLRPWLWANQLTACEGEQQ